MFLSGYFDTILINNVSCFSFFSFSSQFIFPRSAEGGELHPYCVAEEEDAFTERDVVRLLTQILEGVDYLHQKNIVHLDLKVCRPIYKSDFMHVYTSHSRYILYRVSQKNRYQYQVLN